MIVPAHTFIATALAVDPRRRDAVCADVEPGTGLLDPAAAAAAIGPRTAAILPVHLYGQVCAMDALRALAARHGLRCSRTPRRRTARLRGARAGSLGAPRRSASTRARTSARSATAARSAPTTTSSRARARRLRDLGRLDGPRHLSGGYNERLDGLQAAALRVKLRHLDGWNAARRALAARYARAARRLASSCSRSARVAVRLPPLPDPRRRPRRAGAGASRRTGSARGVHYPLSLPEQPALAALHAHDAPVARDWAARELSLPMFPS